MARVYASSESGGVWRMPRGPGCRLGVACGIVGGMTKRVRSTSPEAWRPVVGMRCEVSDEGRVRCGCCGVILKGGLSQGGYRRVRVTRVGGGGVWLKVHIAVLEAFVGPRPSSRHVAAHAPSNDKRDCRLVNLRWATRQENERDKRGVGTVRGGFRPPLTVEQKERIRAASGSITAIACLFGLHRKTVARVRSTSPGVQGSA
jgi:HNH endonuclease